MLKTTFDIREPQKVEMRLTAVMPLEDWIKVRTQLKTDEDGEDRDYWHPASALCRSIDEMVMEAETRFWKHSSPEDEE